MSQPSSAARTSLAYITLGALLLVWTGVWYWYLRAHPDDVLPRTWYICYGLIATGAVLLVIGLAVGEIGRSARHAELPPRDTIQQEKVIDQTAAARPVVVAPAVPAVAAQPGAVPSNPAPAAVPVNPSTVVTPRV
jgi:hypothetical protein